MIQPNLRQTLVPKRINNSLLLLLMDTVHSAQNKHHPGFTKKLKSVPRSQLFAAAVHWVWAPYYPTIKNSRKRLFTLYKGTSTSWKSIWFLHTKNTKSSIEDISHTLVLLEIELSLWVANKPIPNLGIASRIPNREHIKAHDSLATSQRISESSIPWLIAHATPTMDVLSFPLIILLQIFFQAILYN